MAKVNINIDAERCKGCRICVEACPKQIIDLDGGIINTRGFNPARVIDIEACIACGSCAVMCPDCAIEITE